MKNIDKDKPMEKLFFIINPKAGDGHCLKIWRRVEAQLKAIGLPFFKYQTEYPGHGKYLAMQIAKENHGCRLFLIAVGGDGTLHEVVNGIADSTHNITIGYIPGGSGNDFSRGFQLPSDPMQALAGIVERMKGDSYCADIGKINLQDQTEHYFINNMGAGFDALISNKVNGSRIKALLNKFRLGKLVYVYFLLKLLFTYRLTEFELMIDGKKHIFKDTWFVTVSNQPYYGGGMKIAPAAITDDGLFDITVVHQLSKIKLLFVFVTVFSGKHTRFKEVKMFKGRTISISSSLPQFVHADGEFIGHTSLNVQLLQGRMPVLARLSSKVGNIYNEEGDMNEQG